MPRRMIFYLILSVSYISSATKQERQEKQMTRSLLFITFSFLILLAWQCITQCFWMLGYGKHDRVQLNTWKMVDSSFALAKLGVIINSSINWIFYCFTCSMFRKEMRKLFGLKKTISDQPDSFNMAAMTDGNKLNSLSTTNVDSDKAEKSRTRASSTSTVDTKCDAISQLSVISFSNI